MGLKIMKMISHWGASCQRGTWSRTKTSNCSSYSRQFVRAIKLDSTKAKTMSVEGVVKRNEEELDPIQRQLLEEECLVVNEKDEVVGHDSKRNCHSVGPNGEIKLHRAFSVFLFNEEGKLLLQKRSSKKITFPSMWTNTCCSHPLFRESEMIEKDALGIKTAARRRLEYELGIPEDSIGLDELEYLTRIHYKAASNPVWGEHEIDYILFIQKNIPFKPNKNEVDDVAFVNLKEALAMMNQPQKYALTPWFKLILSSKLPSWWSNIKNLSTFFDHEKINKM